MSGLRHWIGDLHLVEGLDPSLEGLICMVASVICGAFIGIERARRDKPAGLRTVILICVGSTIFTMVSLFVGEKAGSDPARIAAQVAPGIGFLGAGAIIHARGMVRGLTTGATIWAVAAVGITIGSGYVAAGIVFTMVIFLTLTVLQNLEWVVTGRCRMRAVTLYYHPEGGKTRIRIQGVLDRYALPDHDVLEEVQKNGQRSITLSACTAHRDHRAVIRELADIHGVERVEIDGDGG
jgi:putative Mg2+ transporter-C (MgtC) family protein